MSFDLILGVILLVLTTGILLLRTRSNFLVLALCAGYVLANTLQANLFDLSNRTSVTVPGISLAQVLQLAVMLLPALIIAFRFHKSQHGVSVVQQLAPTFGAVGLLIVFIQPILEQSSLADTLKNSVLWGLFTSYRLWVILFAIGVSLMSIMVESTGSKRGRPRKKD